MKKLIILLSSVMFSYSAIAADINAGKDKTSMCVACHGSNGVASIKGYPNLKGQNAEYLVKAIKEYKNGERTDPVMSAMAQSIADEDIENIAAYYESLK